MLVLSLNDKIGTNQIVLETASGETITVTLTERSRSRVKLGIDAPMSVRIHRNQLTLDGSGNPSFGEIH